MRRTYSKKKNIRNCIIIYVTVKSEMQFQKNKYNKFKRESLVISNF